MTEKTYAPYLSVQLAGLGRIDKQKWTDLSLSELWTGMNLTKKQRDENGGFINAAVIVNHREHPDPRIHVLKITPTLKFERVN